MSKKNICYGSWKVTSSRHFKQCSIECGQSTHMGFISQTSGKVAISAAKYVWITHSGLCNLDHWSGDTAIEVCEIIFLSRPRI